MPTLIFIDTNIFLDFYRLNVDGLKRELGRIEEHKDSIITSAQIEMEYKRNRQRALLDLLKTVREAPKTPDIPAVLRTSRAAKALETASKKHKKRHSEFKGRISAMLADPTKDPLYRGLNKLFKHKGDLNLHREHP